jgi:hypothetical protein
MNNRYFITSFITTLLLVAGPVFASLSFADSENGNRDDNNQPTERVKEFKVKEEREGTKQLRLEENGLRSCEAKQENIQKRLDQLVKMAENMLAKFTAIAERVRAFYVSKGLSVGNYETLNAEIEVKKVAVTTALDLARTTSVGFICTADDPKGKLSSFKSDMRAVKDALKEYRTSVKNLIVAVRQVIEDREDEEDEGDKEDKEDIKSVPIGTTAPEGGTTQQHEKED